MGERFFGTLRYEHSYRSEAPDGGTFAVEANLSAAPGSGQAGAG